MLSSFITQQQIEKMNMTKLPIRKRLGNVPQFSGSVDAAVAEAKEKKGLIIKTWERCRSFGGRKNYSSQIRRPLVKKSKSCPQLDYTSAYKYNCGEKRPIAPEGCLSVYVGPEKQRFVIKTRYVNHPLFKILLEEAESEYGYSSQGPLALPCNVEIFGKLLVEMDSDDINQKGCHFTRSVGSYRVLSHPI
ncbi:hypothetical protein AgCh_018219 [Apium graveolens]